MNNPFTITTDVLAVASAAGDEVTRRRMADALADGSFDLITQAPDTDALVEACIDAPVQALVVAMDLSMLRPAGGLRLLRAHLPDTPIVVVSVGTARTGVRKALAAGAHGVVAEAEIEGVLPLAVQAACAGQICIPQQNRDQVQPPAFSVRERQVLELVARGYTNGEIAQHLYLAQSTVKSHLSSSFRKLGINSRKEAAAIVLDPDNGLALGLPAYPWIDQPSLATN